MMVYLKLVVYRCNKKKEFLYNYIIKNKFFLFYKFSENFISE